MNTVNDPPGGTTDRGVPQVGRSRKGNKWGLLLVVAIVVILAIAVGLQAITRLASGRNNEKKGPAVISSVLPNLTGSAFERDRSMPSIPAAGPATPLPPVPTPPPQMTAEEKAAAELANRRRKAPMIVVSASNAAGVSPPSAGAGTNLAFVEPSSTRSSTLAEALVATRAATTGASLLRDPNMMVTQGMTLDCVLQTAINSALPGMTSCIVTRNVYSTNGRVLLIDRGSRVVGQYQANQLRQGLARIFVLWTRVETPMGIIINIDSPSTDPLGRSGADGTIDTHFWERFGAAVFVSLIDDVGQYEANKSTNGGSNTVSYGNTINSAQNSASIIVQNSVNIPPTLDKAQGSHINIFVARDLFFGNVYELSAVDAR